MYRMFYALLGRTLCFVWRGVGPEIVAIGGDHWLPVCHIKFTELCHK